ncbi:MAG: hypothetical protein Q8P18_28330 [Pseudomonadota bacterium]|nr:hypothetical protein [Pseudomonadota bacterium]
MLPSVRISPNAPSRALRAALAAWGASWMLVGCLPKESLSRRDEVEADLYALALDMDVRTEGLDLPPFRWHVDGTVAWSYTRTFRDGSLGHLVRLVDTSATIGRSGATGAPGAPVAVRGPADGALVELRAFPDGQLLAVTGGSAWTGGGDHLEVLDLLWPLLSPQLPSSRAEAAAPFVTSWPTWIEGGPKVRTRLDASWKTSNPSTWSYDGSLSGQGGYVAIAGQASGTVGLGTGAESPRLLSHTFDWSRVVTTTWAGGKTVKQDQHIVGSLRHAGRAPAPPLDMPIASDDVAADARALRLRDGRVVEDGPVDLASALPFLLLPDDLTPEEVARLRSAVTGAGSM